MPGAQTDYSIYADCDVLVAGGGLAGIATAVAAARTGARTILVERGGWLGGIGVTGANGLHSFYNIYGAHQSAPRLRVVAGVAQDLLNRVHSLGGAVGHVPLERGADMISMFTPVETETSIVAAAALCQEAGVRLLLHTTVDEVLSTGSHIDAVVVWNKAGRSAIRAKVYVDCTGDGDLAAYAGAPCEHIGADYPGLPYQEYKARNHGAYQTGFTFRLVNLDLQALFEDLDRRGAVRSLAHAIKPGASEADIVRLNFSLTVAGIEGPTAYFAGTSLRPREFTYCNCINYGPIDGLNPDDLTAAEVNLRTRMLAVAAMFRQHLAGCKDCYAAGAAPIVGQRRSRAVEAE